jgi:eukaryotic-like serine/threonine-protein kinase
MTPGAKLGSYEIIAPIGAGGMGEVYRARDTRLKRDVALKVLPEAFARDPGRMARFQREAEVLASLNHPNIAAIYGVEERALVMELVEGESPKGPMPFDEAWKIALQMADALEYAHEKGVVHRDLKPANIKVTHDGVVKLLDFGLAKAFNDPAEASPVEAADSPTIALGGTIAGTILGTAGYMAPEQAKGKRVDRRADIWAWGVVLYELLTGERLFKGEDASDTLAQVLTKQPDLQRVPGNTRRLLQACLQKDPKLRLRDIGDAKQFLGEESVAGPVHPRRNWLAWGVAALAIAGVAGLGFVHFREIQPEPPVLKYTIAPPENSTLHSFAISPDGRAVALAATLKGRRSLWVRRLDSLEMTELAGTEGAQDPFWSPDGREIGFFSGLNSSLRKIPARGGHVDTLIQGRTGGGAWNRDGVILAGGLGGMRRVSASGGSPSVVIPAKPPLTWPAFLPDGRRFLYRIGQGLEEDVGVYVASLDGKESRKIVADRSKAFFVGPQPGSRFGHLLFVRQGVLLAQPVDPDSLQPVGEPFQVAQPITDSLEGFSVSEGGTLLYRAGATADAELNWFDRSGRKSGSAAEPGPIFDFALSPDEKRLIVSRTNSSAQRDLWMQDLEHRTPSRFTLDASWNFRPAWSRDGRYVAFTSNRSGRADLYLKSAIGTVPEKLIFATKETGKLSGDWSHDGKLLLFQDFVPPGTSGSDLFALPIGGGDRIPIVQGDFNQTKAQLSLDDRWLAYVSDESGHDEVYVQPFSTDGKPATERWPISAAGGTDPRWRRDGKVLYYLAADQKLMAVPVMATAGGFAFGIAQALFEVPPLTGPVAAGSFRYAASADGNRFLILMDSSNAAPAPITVVTNWRSALKR